MSASNSRRGSTKGQAPSSTRSNRKNTRKPAREGAKRSTSSNSRRSAGSRSAKAGAASSGKSRPRQGEAKAGSASKSNSRTRSGAGVQAANSKRLSKPQREFSAERSQRTVESKSARTKKEVGSGAQQKQLDHTKPYFIEVDSEHDGQRVDNFLVTQLKGVPKTHIYRIIRKGEVRVNKGRVKQTSRLQEGDSVRIPPIRLSEPKQDVDGARFAFLNRAVLYEDDALLIINKPSGMAVHAGSGIKVGVIEALRALRDDVKYLELAHRLDRETSGCLVLAKKSSALKALNEDFKTNSLKNKRLDKRYLALVKGAWKHGQRRITKPLNTDARLHGERHVVVDESGSYASSIATPVDVSSTASLLEVKLLTGRTHQVRVHCQSEGHPIAGDARYGDKTFNKDIKQHKLSRLFLHASKLTFTHPISGDLVTVSAPLPDNLTVVLESLNVNYQPPIT